MNWPPFLPSLSSWPWLVKPVRKCHVGIWRKSENRKKAGFRKKKGIAASPCVRGIGQGTWVWWMTAVCRERKAGTESSAKWDQDYPGAGWAAISVSSGMIWAGFSVCLDVVFKSQWVDTKHFLITAESHCLICLTRALILKLIDA